MDFRWHKRDCQGQHHVEVTLVFLSGLHHRLHKGILLLLGILLLFQEGEVPLQEGKIYMVYVMDLMVPVLRLLKLLLGNGDQPLEESCLIMMLVLKKMVHAECMCQAWQHWQLMDLSHIR